MARKASSKTESSNTTATIGKEHTDTFRYVQQPGLRADYVLNKGSMSSNQSGDCPARSASLKPKAKSQSLPRQRDIRCALIEADLVDYMVALSGQLFYSTQIPVCLGFLLKTNTASKEASDTLCMVEINQS